MHNKSSVGEAKFLYLAPQFALYNKHLLSSFDSWCLPWTLFTFVHILATAAVQHSDFGIIKKKNQN